jgi:ubiquinone/menaquinone biosynthesis C-methylase UbiE
MNHPILNGTSTYNELFNNKWEIYQKICSSNYMEHRQFSESLNKFLISYFQKGFSMLDLGCGDASFTSYGLLNTTISNYTGIDLSLVALDIANINMTRLGLEPIKDSLSLIQGDFFQILPELLLNKNARFDVVLMSFSLHNLNTKNKDLMIHNIWDILQPNGVFILIDLVSQDNEDRETYIQRYLDGVQNNWSELTPDEYVIVENHILKNYFPESPKTIYELAKKHDFTQIENLWIDSANVAQSLCLYK